ncbi:PHD finger domain protein (Ing1) [Cordyceps fumosorosea ARSEF 2679]|uniref:Chromatin modification-related protein n=1 Tax=Cordyceps fumosorosea (strain ARSEF 2679) TaxID=1081104 RepID=A0A167S617_CORFA|nr:PHD finger domain protein (Ing1) [Cordyceps fumosorosea ARSEF 2679]OAA59294.1 PHD finger domain protein (Ing1) [Cordyceps fumosorosea ARSEF 2679]
MKSAKPTSAEASSHRRSQPVRQTRTNPPRSSINAGRLGAREAPASGPVGDQPIDIYPAITHFADIMTALPKEMVRHFTLLKEVDAKIFAPQEQLFKLVAAATKASLPSAQSQNDALSSTAPASAPMSAQGSSSSAAQSNSLVPVSADEPSTASGVFDPSNIPRRQLFRQTAFKIQEMLVALEEKNHVISTANEALQHQMTRVEDVWPYLENEFSDEAKWGSATHWAYPENRGGKSNFERARRDGAAAISAAAQALADEAAARSDARKQAVQAKKNMRNANHGADMDGSREKKPSSKARKTEDGDNVGLGISAPPNGNASKRRKTEKAAAGGTPMERTISSALGSTGFKVKGGSPRGTPAPEGAKKRRALPTGSAPAKKKPATSGKPASTTSSPVVHSISEPKPGASPAPTNAPRPASSRARQNSVNSTSENGKARRPSITAKATNGSAADKPDVAPEKPANITEVPLPIKSEPGKKDGDRHDNITTTAAPAASKKESRVELPEFKVESTPALPLPATVTTKSGRASKPSTPALATFQEAAAARASRTRNDGAKKAHRKSSTAQLAAQHTADDDATSSMQDEDEGDIDGDEPTYCYCNSVSYGEMVACDSDDCEREWFHLDCVGLKVAPGSKTKWYCEDCKERLRLAGKKVSTR